MLSVVLGFVAIHETSVLSGLTQKMHDHPLMVSNSILAANSHIIEIHRDMKDVVLARNSEELELLISKVDRSERKVFKHIDIAMNQFLGDKNKIQAVHKAFSEWRDIRAEVIELIRKGAHKEAIAITKGKGAAHVELLLKQMSGLIEFARNKAREFLAHSKDTYNGSNLILYTMILVSVLLGAMVTTFVILRVNRIEQQLEVSNSECLRLGRIAEETTNEVYIFNAETLELVQANRAARQNLGYSMDELLELTPIDIKPDISAAEFNERIKPLCTGEVGSIYLQTTHQRKDGTCYDVDVTLGLLETETPKLIFAIVQDITERKRNDELLRRSQKMDALGKLTGGIAHDFNNMLGVILGYSELLKPLLAANPKQVKYVDKIYNAGERAKNLTLKLLSFARQETAPAEKVDIAELLKGEKDLLEKTLTARIKLMFDLDENLWPVWVDRGGLSDTILNISINAMHAMPDGGSFTIDARNLQLSEIDVSSLGIDPGDYVVLSFTDTGGGMSRLVQQNIFDPFFTTKGTDGIGLGLSQAYGFAQQSEGSVQVYSELGQGAKIVLFIPRYKGSKTDKKSEGAAILNESLLGNETILVVDDEPALRELTLEILTPQGYRVLTAGDGEDALNLLASESVDLMVSDVIMPGMNGFELASKVQQDYPAVKIQMVSGFSDSRNEMLEDNHLYQQMLSKPFDSQSLLKRIRELLDED